MSFSDKMNLLCSNCGLDFGSHQASDNKCPGHAQRMDYAAGPGTTFKDSGMYGEIEKNTPARRWPDGD